MAMPLVWNNQLHQEFETALKTLLEEIFNPNFPFHPTQDAKTCESCAFAQLCHS
jgi:CRISPR/Cas system-associated exonuclease Cas4 (RecB family)